MPIKCEFMVQWQFLVAYAAMVTVDWYIWKKHLMPGSRKQRETILLYLLLFYNLKRSKWYEVPF